MLLRRSSLVLLVFLVASLMACDSTSLAGDAGAGDAGAGPEFDASQPDVPTDAGDVDGGAPIGDAGVDAGGRDAGASETDAGEVDAGTGAVDGGVEVDGGLAVDGGQGERDAGQQQQDAGPVDAGPTDAGSVDAGPTDAGQSGGLTVETFSLVTYNVAGLPALISPSDPVTNMPFIGPFLSDYDLALVQEDFWYHPALNAGVDLPFRSAPELTAPTLLAMGDGLNRFSNMSIETHTRFDWQDCYGFQECENDCFTNKGFSFSTIEVGPGLYIDVYNLHMDAGTCAEDFVARQGNADQLAAEIATRSAGHAVIIAGDTNLNLNRPVDVGILDGLVATTGTQIACRVGVCQGESIDRILFRSGDDLLLTVESRERPTHFLTPGGDALSDHRPTVVNFSLSQL